MITDEELAGLPDDPQLAFVEFERICRGRVQEAEQEVSDTRYGDADPQRLEYINKVVAAAKEYKIDNIANWMVPPVNDRIYEIYKQFTTDVDHATITIRLRNAPRIKKYSVGLDQTTKTKIHHYVEQIREAIGQAALPVKKRDTLYDKLNAFAAEVDRIRTRFEAAMALYVDLCDGIGQGFNKLEPARKFIDSISTLMGRAKSLEDESGPALPPPPKRIEPPRRSLPAPPSSDLDDEIPF
jgi:hypothetical protein